MGSISDVLKKSIVFKSLEVTDLQGLIPLFERWELHTGDVITTAGETAQYFFIVERGTLLLAMDQGRSVVLSASGDFIAMELLSARGIYKATTTALENGVVFAVPRGAFLAFIQEDTPGAAAIMDAWQDYLDQRAGFVKIIEDIDVPAIF